MLLKTVITGLAAAALIAASASAPTYAAGGGHGGAGNRPQEGLGTGRSCASGFQSR
jgi:hypothetical protein